MGKKNVNEIDGKERKPGGWLLEFKEGRMLSLEFFRNHAWLIMIATVVVLGLIGQRYTNHSKMRKIKKLEQELAIAKSEQISEKAMYMSLIRENEMRRLLRASGLALDYQEQPPYVLTR